MKKILAADYQSLQQAIDAANPAEETMVVVGAGVHNTGALNLHSNLTLHLEKGAHILFASDPHEYARTPVFTRWEGVECWCMHPLLFAENATNIRIEGEGILDGNGKAWWDLFRGIEAEDRTTPREDYELALARLNPDYAQRPGGGARPSTQFLRPPLLQFLRCSDITLSGIQVQNSPFWTLHFVYSEHIQLLGLTVKNPADAINTDAVDLDSCTDALIENCVFDVGDDAITLKSGSGPDGVRINRPTTHVTARNCTIYASHGGIAIGSETAGGISDVTVTDCRFIGTQRAIRLKSRRGRGGTIERISLSHLSMQDCWCPIVLGQYFAPGVLPQEKAQVLSEEPQPVTELTPHIRDIKIEHVRAVNVRSTAAFIVGLPEAPIENVSVKDFTYTLAPEDRLLPTSLTEPTDGHFHDDNRGIKIINARNVSVN